MTAHPTYRFSDYYRHAGLDQERVQRETVRAFEMLHQLARLNRTDHLLSSSHNPIAWAAHMFGQTEHSQEKQIEALSQACARLITTQPCYVDLEAIQEEDGYQLLHVAAECGLDETLAVLLEAGAPIDHPAPLGTPLMLAIHTRQQPVIDKLIAAGADIQKGAAEQLHVNHTPYCNRPIHEASVTNQPGVIAQLVAHGADVHAYNISGQTALSSITLSSCREAARMLLDLGANPNQPDALRADFPLNVAATIGSDYILSLLLDYGADMHACATHNKQTGSVELMQRYNATDSHIKNTLLAKRWQQAWECWDSIDQAIRQGSLATASLSAKDIVLCANIGKENEALEAVLQQGGQARLGELLEGLPVWIQEAFSAQHPWVMNRPPSADGNVAAPSWTHKVGTGISAKYATGRAVL